MHQHPGPTVMRRTRPEELVGAGRYEEAVVALVEERDHVSIAEIQRLLGERMPVHGDLELGWEELNVWFAFGVSRELADIIQCLRAGGEVTTIAANPLIYFADGCALPVNMPLARRVPKGGYTRPHFAPVVFRLSERAAWGKA